LRRGHWLTEFSWQTLGRELHHRLLDYLLGSVVIALPLAAAAGLIVFVLASLYRHLRSASGEQSHD